MKKLICGICLLVATFIIGGCTASDTEKANGNEGTKNTKTIIDTYGRYVEIPEEVNSAVVLNSGVYDLIRAVGATDKVVGITDSTKLFPNDSEKQIVGTWKEPSVEKILSIKPDIVFGYKKYTKPETAKQLEEAGIPVVYIDAYKVENMAAEISTIGSIFNKQDIAKNYLEFLNKYQDLLATRLSEVEDDKKVKVYWEGYSDYTTVSKGTGGDGVISSAGGLNIAGNEKVEYPKISDEWVIKHNPEVMVKVVSNSKNILGSDIKNTDEVKKVYESLVTRTGMNTVDAVKNKNLYIISSDIATSPQGSVIGSLYLAKWLYPEIFEDINPEEVHKEMLEKFYGLTADGIWVYNGK